jgi:hypothetical protein
MTIIQVSSLEFDDLVSKLIDTYSLLNFRLIQLLYLMRRYVDFQFTSLQSNL